MAQVAVLVSGSNSRKVGHPLVPQKSLELAVAAVDRRRMRRIADARPVTDAVVERFIMVLLYLCFLARRDREMSDRLRGRGFVPCRYRFGNDCFESVCAPGRERCLRSNRVVASDWLLVNYLRKPPIRQTADGPGWSAAARWSGRFRRIESMIQVSSPKIG
jgi:hypothetical protein